MNRSLPLALLTLAVLACPLSAQDDPPPDVQEQTIYIPYAKLQQVFEKEGRGVFLPYDKFQGLWKAARKQAAPPPKPKSPVDAFIASVESEANVREDVMHVKASLRIEVMDEGWKEVPLRLDDAAILHAWIDGEPARIVHDKGGYKLLVHHEGKGARQFDLQLEYAKSLAKTPGRNSVSFQAPQAPVNHWRIHVPEKGVEVNVHPLLAATRVTDPAAQEVALQDAGEAIDNEAVDGELEDEPDNAAAPKPRPPVPPEDDAAADDETVVLAFVGAAPEVRIDWTPQAEGATGLDALIAVQVSQEVFIDDGVVRTRAALAYDVTRSSVSTLKIEAPADQKVVNVFDPNVKQWDVAGGENQQTITVQLFEPVRGSQNFTVELEKFTDENVKQVSVPAIKAAGAARQQGVVVAQPVNDLKAEIAERSGLFQLDAAELPQPLQNRPWAFAFRYSSADFKLVFDVEKVLPRVRASQLVEAYLTPEALTVDLSATFEIERAGVFQLSVDIPDGYEIRQVRGHNSGAAPVEVDSRRLENNGARLVVELARKAIGKAGLFVELQKPLDDVNLLTPTGAASTMSLTLPQVTRETVEQTTGRFVVYAPESLQVSLENTVGLTSISLGEAWQPVTSARDGRFPQARPLTAFAFAGEAASLDLSAQRRKPQVTVEQLLVARINPGVVKYEATFYWTIRHSGVKSLRIDIPESLAPEVRNLTDSVRDAPISPAPEDAPQGYVAWEFVGQSEFFGQQVLRLQWEQKLDFMEVRAGVELTPPHLRPAGVDRATGQIVATKAESLDVRVSAEPQGLRPIDPQYDLMQGVSLPGAARAFEFLDDWSLTLSVTRYELEEVKRTSVERAVVRVVATRGGALATQALYRLRSAQQRLALKLPEKAEFDMQQASIDGRPVSLEKGDQDQLYVPLSQQSPDTPFLLELRYTTPGSQKEVSLPDFPDDPAVQQVDLCVYIPENQALLASRGPWTPEGDDFFSRISPSDSRYREQQVIDELLEGVPTSSDVAGSFPTAGTLHIFTALRPQAPPDGSLRLSTIDRTLLQSLVFAIVALPGLLLLRWKFGARLVALALLVAGIVVLGVVAPTFAAQILDGVFAAALGLVVMVWSSVGVAKWSKRPRPQRREQASQPAASNDQGDSSSDIKLSDVVERPSDDASEAAENDEKGGDHNA